METTKAKSLVQLAFAALVGLASCIVLDDVETTLECYKFSRVSHKLHSRKKAIGAGSK